MSASTSSSPPSPGIRVILAAEPLAVLQAGHAVTALASEQSVAAARAADIALAVSEAVAYLLVHADDEVLESGAIVLAAERDRDALHVVVREDGPGVKRRAARMGFGAGLATIGKIARSLEVRTAEGGRSEICMTFALARA